MKPNPAAKGPVAAIMLALVLAICILVSAAMGYMGIPISGVARILGANIPGLSFLADSLDPLHQTVVMDVRLPRILTSAFVGGALAVSGAAFQGLLRNPLADPYTLGVSAGAAFGAALAFLLNLNVFGIYTVSAFAFAGALASLAVVIHMSSGGGGISSSNLILSGIIVGAILAAGISFLKYLADEQVSVIIFWLMGSFAGKTWADTGAAALAAAGGLVFFWCFGRDLNLMALGERSASALGVDVKRATLMLLVAASLVAAVCVAVSGIIGFVGLLVPHMMRWVVGPDHRRLIPVCLLAGAVLLLAADTVTRAVLPAEVPIGVLTALIGGPFFCYVFKKSRRTMGGSP